MSKEIADRVHALADSILSNDGMELVEIEYRRESRGWVLRLYVDREGGVSLYDCARISQDLGRVLDIEDFIPNPYTLEISSPGLNRSLKREKDFVKYRNHLVKVKTFDPIGNRHQFRGKLLGLFENQIEMEVDGGIVHIPLSNVAKANLELEF